MPRMPVDGEKVVEHRITLGGKERQMIDELTTAYQVKNIGGTFVDIISSPAIGSLLIGAIVLYLNQKLDPDWQEITSEMTPDQLKDWLETQNLIGGGLGLLLGGILGGPFGALLGGVVGVGAVEVGEAALDATANVIEENVPPSVTIFVALQIVNSYNKLKNLVS